MEVGPISLSPWRFSEKLVQFFALWLFLYRGTRIHDVPQFEDLNWNFGVMGSDCNNDRYDQFVDLFSRNAKRVYGCIYAMLPHWDDADDVFQETSRVLWEKFGEFDSSTNFFAWARQIARYQVLAFRQSERRSHVKFTDTFLDVVATAADAANERLEAEQRALAACVEMLKPREREIILLRFASGATTKSVAARLNMTTDAIYKGHKPCANRFVELRRTNRYRSGTGMTLSPVQRETLDSLLRALHDDQLVQEQASELEQLVLSDVDAIHHYLRVVNLQVGLRWMAGDGYDGHETPSCHPPIRHSLASDEVCSPPIPIHALLDASIQSTVGYFISGWPVAYLVATVIFGIGLAIGAITRVSQPVQVVKQSATVTEERVKPAPELEPVGRITGMVDCRWAGSHVDSSSVCLGQEFALASGLMKITYNTGANVILQGPMTYAVESRNGGFLSLGRLTGKVTAASAKGFVVRTPTATVTDLGTEFGVEVKENRSTETYVFVGQVEVASSPHEGASGDSLVLNAGQSVSAASGKVVLLDAEHRGQQFAHRIPSSLTTDDVRRDAAYGELVQSLRPVAFYRMQRQSTEENRSILSDSAPRSAPWRAEDSGRRRQPLGARAVWLVDVFPWPCDGRLCDRTAMAQGIGWAALRVGVGDGP